MKSEGSIAHKILLLSDRAQILDLADYNYVLRYVRTSLGSQSLFTLVLLTYLHGYLCTAMLIIFGALLHLQVFSVLGFIRDTRIALLTKCKMEIYILFLSCRLFLTRC